MKTSIETLKRGMISQLAEIDRDLLAVEGQVKELRSARRQLAAALRAIGGEDPGGKATKPAPKKKQVREAIEQLLAERDGIVSGTDLERLVADRLTREQGCSAVGLGLRLREVLKSDEFLVRAGEVRLASRVERAPVESRVPA